MYDYHIHSEYSMDSKAKMNDIVKSAISNDLKAICFTDHTDLKSGLERVDFAFDTDKYFKEINQLKMDYDGKIEIFAGIELGMQVDIIDESNSFIAEREAFQKFDYILMSIHNLLNMDIAMDKFTNGKEPLHALISYYEAMYECVEKFDNFDILGHIDYIDRYFSNFDEIPHFNDYSHYVTRVLEVIIKKGKGIEINTAGLRYKLGYFHPKIQILKLYKRLGGEILTIGSDSHTVETIGYGYDEVVTVLKELGFKKLYIFKNRERIPLEI